MTQGFDNWFKDYHNKHEAYAETISSDSYKAGAASRQVEVDELQKRITITEKWIEDNKRNIPLSEWHGYTTEEYVDADDLLQILKGERNEP